MAALVSKVRWGRVVLAGIATHIVNIVVILVSTLVTVGLQASPDQGSIGERSAQIGTWGVPVLTIAAAIWVVRAVEPEIAALHGVLVGVLVAMIFGLVFFWPFDRATLALFVCIVVGGLIGGLIGRRRRLPC